MPPICRLIDRRCPHCRSQLVQAVDAGTMDRIICPICLASGESTDVLTDLALLKRGTPIDSRLRFLVDKARFPRAGAAPADRPDIAQARTADTTAAEDAGRAPPPPGSGGDPV